MKIRKIRYKVKRIYSPWKKKLLLFLLSAFVAGSTSSSNKINKFWSSLPEEFKKIDRKYLNQLIQEFYRDRLVDIIDTSDEETKIVITKRGKLHAMRFKVDDMKFLPPKYWDKKWRVVVFDIPEKMRKARNELRHKLKSIGFYELQKSVLVFPYDCKNEVDFLLEFFKIHRYVRYGCLESITNEAELRRHFDLT